MSEANAHEFYQAVASAHPDVFPPPTCQDRIWIFLFAKACFFPKTVTF